MISLGVVKKATVVSVAAAMLSIGLSLPAGATLIGDTIDISSSFGAPLSEPTDSNVLVGAGAELTQGDNSNHDLGPDGTDASGDDFLFNTGDAIDVGDSSITFSFAPDTIIFAFITTFSDLDWIGFPDAIGLVGASISDPSGLLLSGAQANVIDGSTLEFQGSADLINISVLTSFTINLEVDHSSPPPPPTDVPEPGTLATFALGLMGILLFARRRRHGTV